MKDQIILIGDTEFCDLIDCYFKDGNCAKEIRNGKLHCSGVCNSNLCCIEKFLTVKGCKNCITFREIPLLQKMVMQGALKEYKRKKKKQFKKAVI